MPHPNSALILTGRAMSAPETCVLAGGRAAVFSCGKPGGEEANEDALAVLELGGARGVLAVADGAGGHPNGARAAAVTLEALADSIDGDTNDDLRGSLLDGIESANRRVQDLGGGAASTLAVLEIEGRTVRPYHVGDSEILVVGQRGRVRLSIVPHSPTGYAVESGLLEPAEAIAHEDRHLVSNLVGTADMRIEIGSVLDLQPRDTVLIASDGLFDNLRVDEIVNAIRSGPLERAAHDLLRDARRRMQSATTGEPSKPDDLTFVLYRIAPATSAEGATP